MIAILDRRSTLERSRERANITIAAEDTPDLLLLEKQLNIMLREGKLATPPSVLSYIFAGARAWRIRPITESERDHFKEMLTDVLAAIARASAASRQSKAI